jgi:hypothetical protein
MEEKTEFIITGEGRCMRRSIIESYLECDADIAKALAAGIIMPIRNCFEVPEYGTVSGNTDGTNFFWTVRMHSLPIRATFKLIKMEGSKWMSPCFTNEGTMLNLTWTLPETMFLYRLIWTTLRPNGLIRFAKTWMVATSSSKEGWWKLPLANIYDDGSCCTGEFSYEAQTHQAAVAAEIKQFLLSAHNTDLMKSPENTQSLFRFTPNNETFEQQPILPPSGRDKQDWTRYCEKVSVEQYRHIIK